MGVTAAHTSRCKRARAFCPEQRGRVCNGEGRSDPTMVSEHHSLRETPSFVCPRNTSHRKTYVARGIRVSVWVSEHKLTTPHSENTKQYLRHVSGIEYTGRGATATTSHPDTLSVSHLRIPTRLTKNSTVVEQGRLNTCQSAPTADTNRLWWDTIHHFNAHIHSAGGESGKGTRSIASHTHTD